MDIRLRVFTGDTPAVLQCLLQQRAANRLAPVSCDSWNWGRSKKRKSSIHWDSDGKLLSDNLDFNGTINHLCL